MEFAAFANRLAQRFAQDVAAETPAKGEPFVRIAPVRLAEAAAFLRDDSETDLKLLNSISGVDFPARGEIEVVYHASSLRRRHLFALKAVLPRDNPRLPTVEGIWPAASWHERECYDLFGVVFEGHSDLRRILLPDDWEGFPLRKDYKPAAFWHGMKIETDH